MTQGAISEAIQFGGKILVPAKPSYLKTIAQFGEATLLQKGTELSPDGYIFMQKKYSLIFNGTSGFLFANYSARSVRPIITQAIVALYVLPGANTQKPSYKNLEKLVEDLRSDKYDAFFMAYPVEDVYSLGMKKQYP